jgi:hypothetical protein
MYEIEESWDGFHWIHHDDFTQCVLAFRRLDTKGNGIIAVCNFLPIKREHYNIGVPHKGIYEEVFNTDSIEFGGEGLSNGQNIKTVEVAMHGYDQSLELTIPPLSVMYFKCKERIGESKGVNVAKEDEETIEGFMQLSGKIAVLEGIENSDIDKKQTNNSKVASKNTPKPKEEETSGKVDIIVENDVKEVAHKVAQQLKASSALVNKNA